MPHARHPFQYGTAAQWRCREAAIPVRRRDIWTPSLWATKIAAIGVRDIESVFHTGRLKENGASEMRRETVFANN
jgi:hypothetical protein